MPMRIEDRVKTDYFEWMYDLVCRDQFAKTISYRKLLTYLHDTEFIYFIPYDENRASEGESLRYRFCLQENCEELEWCLFGPCSVLEMMIALSIRCEEIMDDIGTGDRTSQWFWSMITNMGLGGQHDAGFDERLVEDVVERFLNREYEFDGRGGLFRVRGWHRDMRDAEIWHQLMAYINSMDMP